MRVAGSRSATVRTHTVRAHVSCRTDQSRGALTEHSRNRVTRFGRPVAAVSIQVCCRMCQFRGAPRCKRLQRSGEPIAAVSIHVCVCCAEYIISGVHQRTKGYKGLTDQLLLRARTHTHTASCRIRKFRAAPEDQGLRRFGRRRAAASIHTLVAE